MEQLFARATLLLQLLCVCGCGGTDQEEPPPTTPDEPVEVTGMKLWPSVVQVQQGQTVPLFATNEAGDLELAAEWAVDDPAVASIEPVDGGLALLTVSEAGAVEVEASYDEFSASKQIAVAPPAPDAMTMELLAAAVSGLKSDRMLRAELTVAPRQDEVDEELATTLAEVMPGVRTLSVAIDPESFGSATPITGEMLTVGPTGGIGPTCDPVVEWGLSVHLDRMDERGFDTALFREGMEETCLVSEGDTAAGVFVSEQHAFPQSRALGVPGQILTNGPGLLVQLTSDPTVILATASADHWRSDLRYPSAPPTEMISALVAPWLAKQGITVPASAANGVGLAYFYEVMEPPELEPHQVAQWSEALRGAHTCTECVEALDLREPAGATHTCVTESSDLTDDVTITVLDAGGNPAADVDVYFRAGDESTSNDPVIGRTDGSGEVTMDVYTGATIQQYRIEAGGAAEVVDLEARPSQEMLVMATDVAGEFGGVLEAGSSIDLATACGSLVAANADDSCDSPHLHSETGLWIDGDGPFLDPDPGGCGFGTLE